MAKTGKSGNVGMIAFIAVILVALSWCLVGLHAALVAMFQGNDFSFLLKLTNILRWVADIFAVVVMVWASYDFAQHQTKPWRVIWWILAIIAICAVVGLGGRNVFNI